MKKMKGDGENGTQTGKSPLNLVCFLKLGTKIGGTESGKFCSRTNDWGCSQTDRHSSDVVAASHQFLNFPPRIDGFGF